MAVAAVLAMPMGMGTANAEPDYPPKFYKISASSYTTPQYRSITFTAQTFRSGSAVAVDVSVDGASVGSSGASANGKGIATTSVKFTVVGVNTVTMSGTSDSGEPLALSADITVTEPAAGNGGGSGDGGNASDDANAGGVPFIGGGLPRTGAEIAGTLLVAAALIGAGFLLVVATRRRRASH